MEVSPRVRLAYETSHGAGLGTELWKFHHAVQDGLDGDPSVIDTYSLDIGLYKKLGLGTGSRVELSDGVRYNDFRDDNVTEEEDVTRFGGLGGFVGLRGWQHLGFKCDGYARMKWAMLFDDEAVDGGDSDYDVVRRQQEIALGVERCTSIGSCLASVRLGAEWIGLLEYQDGSEGDVVFSGLVLGLTLAR